MIRVPALDVGRVGPHQLDDLVERRVVERVDLVVPGRHLAGLTASTSTRARRMPWTRTAATLAPSRAGRRSRLSGGSGASLRTCLATDDGVVAHPLELVRHVVEREQEAQVAGDRLLGRDRHAR